MKRVFHHWKRIPRAIRAPLVLVAGMTILVVGLALLVLPGPGWVIIFLGIAILASEFAIAEKMQTQLVGYVKRITGGLKRVVKKEKPHD